MKNFTKLIFIILLLLMSQDVFTQWVPTYNSLYYTPYAFAVTNSSIFALSNVTNGLGRSTNYGMNWVYSFNPDIPGTIASFNDDIYFGASKIFSTGGGIYRSTNEGVNWTLIGFNNHSVHLLAVTSTNIYADTDTGFYRSTNIGASWIKIPLIDNNISSIVTSGTNVFVGSLGLIYRSTNNGVNWTSFNVGPASNVRFNTITVSGSNIFAAGQVNLNPDSGVYKSTNNGQNWINIGLKNAGVNALATSGYNLFAATNILGVYYSTNAGGTWIQKNENLMSYEIKSIIVYGDYVIIGGGGNPYIWRRFLLNIINVKKISTEVPNKYKLYQNYPNPFNPTTNIKYQIGNSENGKLKTENGLVSIKVFDMLGKTVATLVNEKQSPGIYEVTFNGGCMNSGVYFYQLTAGNYKETKKLLLIK